MLGYLGAVMLVTGIAITAIGPAELGIIDDGTDDGATTAAEATAGAPAATASDPSSGAAAVGTAPGASENTNVSRNATDGD